MRRRKRGSGEGVGDKSDKSGDDAESPSAPAVGMSLTRAFSESQGLSSNHRQLEEMEARAPWPDPERWVTQPPRWRARHRFGISVIESGPHSAPSARPLSLRNDADIHPAAQVRDFAVAGASAPGAGVRERPKWQPGRHAHRTSVAARAASVAGTQPPSTRLATRNRLPPATTTPLRIVRCERNDRCRGSLRVQARCSE